MATAAIAHCMHCCSSTVLEKERSVTSSNGTTIDGYDVTNPTFSSTVSWLNQLALQTRRVAGPQLPSHAQTEVGFDFDDQCILGSKRST